MDGKRLNSGLDLWKYIKHIYIMRLESILCPKSLIFHRTEKVLKINYLM